MWAMDNNELPKPKRRFNKKVRIAVIGIVIVLFCAGGVLSAYFLLFDRSEVAKEVDPSDATTPEASAHAVKEAQEQFAALDAEERAEAEESLARAQSLEERAEAYRRLANSYSAEDMNTSLDYARKAAETDGSYDSFMMVLNFADAVDDAEAAAWATDNMIRLGGSNNEVE